MFCIFVRPVAAQLVLRSTHVVAHHSARSTMLSTSLVCSSTSTMPQTVRKLAQIAGNGIQSTNNSRDRALFTAVKYLRIPALIVGVYGFGYQMGIMDTIGNPEKKERAILESVCRSAGCSNPNDSSSTRMISDGSMAQLATNASLLRHDPQLHRVASVGRRIVKVARQEAKRQREEELVNIKAELPAEVANDPARFDRVVQLNELINNPVAAASQIMDGDWTYVLLDSPAPNAFVTSMLPRKIFVTTAMMDQLVDSDEEMALVLGHEVSHLLLGHVKNRTIAEAVLTTLEIVLLTTLSAVGGVGTLYNMSMLASVKRWASNAYSRESERQADAFGIKLAAMACYDTEKGIEVFKKMQALDPPGVSFLTIELDHPPTEERYNWLVEASKEENASKYKESTCKNLREVFRSSF